MLPYVHCPFCRTIFKGLGSRRYILESNDFFALRDLIDLSKGVFAGDGERCRSCGLVFHKPCFRKTTTCPCGVSFMVDKTKERLTKGAASLGSNERGTVDTQADFKSSVGFLSGLFTKGRREKLLERKADDNVILMGSLPSTSL